MSILPTPLHPAIVHLPMAIVVLTPLFAVGALLAIRKGVRAVWAWGVPVALIGCLMLSGWASLQTGGQDEDRVERTAGEAAVETHEEAAEGFLVATGVVLLLSLGGFAGGKVGTVTRGLATAATVALLGLGYNVGHSGGALVYGDGSTMAAAGSTDATGVARRERAATDDDDD